MPSAVCDTVVQGVAAGLTTPLDVVKTRLQTQLVSGGAAASPDQCVGERYPAPDTARYRGLVGTFRRIIAEEGWMGLSKGARPRILFVMPSAAISWVTYEAAKRWFREQNRPQHNDDGDSRSNATEQ